VVLRWCLQTLAARYRRVETPDRGPSQRAGRDNRSSGYRVGSRLSGAAWVRTGRRSSQGRGEDDEGEEEGTEGISVETRRWRDSECGNGKQWIADKCGNHLTGKQKKKTRSRAGRCDVVGLDRPDEWPFVPLTGPWEAGGSRVGQGPPK